LGRSRRADVVGFWDSTEYSARLLPADKLRDYHVAGSEPIFEVPVAYKDIDEYLKSLTDRNLAAYVKRAFKRSRVLTVRTRQPEQWLDRIYELYCAQVGKADASFGAQRKAYFENVCK